MEQLEIRIYTRQEISAITGHDINSEHFARDVMNKLDHWGYSYEWIMRQGVRITRKPESAEERLTEWIRRNTDISIRTNAYEFACFISAFSVIDGFSSMPWEERTKVFKQYCGKEVSQTTLQRWMSKLVRGGEVKRFSEGRLWRTFEDENGEKQREPIKQDDKRYIEYCAQRSEALEELGKRMPQCQAWGEIFHQLYPEFGTYYCCPEFCLTAYDGEIEELVELVQEIAGKPVLN